MSSNVVHVAVGVIRNSRGEILVARRHPHAHQGGLWEFPGGKLEHGESVQQALTRELHEELGITPQRFRPLLRIHHDYKDKQVLLDVWQIDAFSGEPHGKEKQPLMWKLPQQLGNLSFPAANLPIVRAVNLPPSYLISGRFDSEAEFLGKLVTALANGIRLFQFRVKERQEKSYSELARKAIQSCREYGATVLLNSTPEEAMALDADGVHLTSARLMALQQRPLPCGKLVAASVHNPLQLRQANLIGVDFSVIAPVMPTASHPGAQTLGWRAFQRLAEEANHPVYALGGMRQQHLEEAWQHGGQGIAAIRSLWPGE